VSERITEAELLYWETRGGPQQRLVTEVRRLRGLIVRQDEAHSCADNLIEPDFEAEARAIREEQGLT